MTSSQRRSGLESPFAGGFRWVLAIAAVVLSVPIVVASASQPYPLVDGLLGRIVYTRAASNNRDFAVDIYLADANGDGEERLTNTVDAAVYGSAAGEDQPRWSPDGSQIAFSTYNKDGLASVWRVQATGGTPTPIAQNDGEGGGGPAWQPDGRCVVYAGAHRGGASTLDLRRACLDGTVETLLDTADMDERGADVSPDGKKIVYQARRPPRSFSDRTEWSLRLINADGSGDAALFAATQGSATNPRWSPDMERIAFVSGMAEGVGTLSVLELATGQVTALVTKAAGPIAWSPDGHRIMFHNVDASGPRLLASDLFSPLGVAQDAQYKGLYVLYRPIMQLSRLRGPAGGEGAGTISYQWGYAPDWWAPSATPTATATATPTPTATSSPMPTATATATSIAQAWLPLVAYDVLWCDEPKASPAVGGDRALGPGPAW